MPNPRHLDETTAEAILRTPSVALARDDPLATFFQEVRGVVDQPAPAPSPALALVLRSGFSNPPIDPLATAVSAAKEKQHSIMKSTGILKGLTGKILAVSTVLLVGVGTAAAAGALPGIGHSASSHSISSVSTAASTTGKTANVGVSVPVVGHVGAKATLPTAAGGAAGAGVSAAGVNAGVNAGIGSVGANAASSAGSAGSGSGSTLGNLTASLTGCVDGVFTTVGNQPLVALTTALPTVVACVKNVVGSLPLPSVVSSCVSGLLNSLNSLPVIGGGKGQIDLTGCIPINLTTCLQAALNSVGGLLGGLTGAGALPNGVIACATSIVNGVINLVNSVLSSVTGTLGQVTAPVGGLVPSASASVAHSTTTTSRNRH
jgi:hypothetical protein